LSRIDATVLQTKLPPDTDTEEEQEKLLRDGALILDQRDRDNVSVPYRHSGREEAVQRRHKAACTTSSSSPGNIERCYVARVSDGAPAKRADFVTVIRTEGTPDWVNTRADHVFALSRIEGKEFDSWFNSLPEAEQPAV
jgi:hypothetical protein